MSEPKYRQWILETIDSLRSRKARPDLERICRMVRRRHGSDPDQTRAELEKLIEEQTVLKVSYKGSISYRNAAKVQRKCRKRMEQNSGSGESVREPTKHANGDSAHSFTDHGECEDRHPEDRGVSPCPDHLPQTSLSTLERGEKDLPQPSGNRFSCGATGSSVGSVKASASKDDRLIARAGGSGSALRGDASSACKRPDGENTLGVGHEEGSDDQEQKTCSSVNSPPPRNKLPASPKPKGSGTRSSETSADLGDRLVVAVRSLSESLRRGHAPLALKEILGYLGTQSGMPGEKLTRNRVKVVLEREIEMGRLRRSRLGHITLPARGMGAAKPSARLLKSALQDGHLAKKEEVKEEERIETEGEEDGTKKNAVSTAEDVPKTITDEGPTGVEACTDPISTDMEVEADNGNSFLMTSEGKPQITSPLESSNQCAVQQEVDVGGSEEQTVSVESEDAGFENSAVTPDQLHPSTEDNVIVTSDTVKAPLSIPIRNCSGCKMEVSSCLLTPSASPGAAEERGMNEGIGGFVKLESNGLNPADWTVADVASYFTTAGFPEQAHAFRTQEIDGKSLLLMQRNDVLTGLSIRLGPALKIYERHVKMLQRTHFQDDESFC
ncbi:sterile alpha motif domain-containing protein 1-like isoform X2 [Myxocyprinus asiaticus]|uniref:sterile alpha motif domain-containing protein 1-like isoform X2 n=1 Tax=Myxocyprinus asiaticus TaxID=70543 RepID=UPI002222840E|nr:sterile alpha motif domain-containing protein 1-like isoform X2 [Myxocyprinus asiaticus]